MGTMGNPIPGRSSGCPVVSTLGFPRVVQRCTARYLAAGGMRVAPYLGQKKWGTGSKISRDKSAKGVGVLCQWDWSKGNQNLKPFRGFPYSVPSTNSLISLGFTVFLNIAVPSKLFFFVDVRQWLMLILS